jgi:hypothetical protein
MTSGDAIGAVANAPTKILIARSIAADGLQVDVEGMPLYRGATG